MTPETLEKYLREIASLEKEIEQAHGKNHQIRRKSILKKLRATLKTITALSAIPLAGATITKMSGWDPKKLNEYEAYAIITTIIDEKGNVQAQKDYIGGTGEGVINTRFEFYTKWSESKTGNYEREVYSWSLYDVTEDDLKRIILLNNSELNIEKIKEFVNSFSHETHGAHKQFCSEIPPEDFENQGKVQLSSRIRDKKDTKVVTESQEMHDEILFTKKAVVVAFCVVEFGVLLGLGFFKKRRKELTEKPQYIDTTEQEIELAAKRIVLAEMPYKHLQQEQVCQPEQQIIEQPEPQKVLKKEPKRMQQQGQ